MDKIIIKVRCNNGITTTVEADDDSTIEHLKRILCQKLRSDAGLEIETQKIRVIFAGHGLHDSQSIRECMISNFSLVHAILRPRDSGHEYMADGKSCNLNYCYPISGLSGEGSINVKVVDEIAVPGYNGISHFYVFCKRCQTIKPGKLRARCSKCKESSVTLARGPESWNDILNYGRVEGTCQLECSRTFIEFYFKCGSHSTDNDEWSAPLYQIRNNTRAIPCLICYEIRDIVLVFSCESGHTLCIRCFRDLCLAKMSDKQFDFVEGIGYTISCPVGCENSYIKDCHHFRILGEQNYERYHKFGAEELTLSLGGILCPAPNCGQGILADSNANCIECPDKFGCGLIFCRRCLKVWHEGSCEAHESQIRYHDHAQPLRITAIDADRARWEREAEETIKKISKPCPKCNTPTQKNGGCMHMSCPISRCKFQWCWICCTEWNNNCRDNHWFGL